MKISPSRTAGYDILFRIETEKAYSSALLPSYEADLSADDRGLCHEIVLGTLRRQMWLDRSIDELASGKRLDIEVRIALRLGLYQLLFLTRIPAYSAINESVELVRRAKKTSAKGFVNAILRKANVAMPKLVFRDEIERISVEHSHPRWLIERWSAAFGSGEAEKIAAANNEVPATAFRVIGQADREVETLLRSSRRSDVADGCYVSDGSDRSLHSFADQGKIYIQDEASQMTALALEVPSNGYFLDVCAAPGGKTGLVAGRSRNASLIAGDLYRGRIMFLRENCRRQNVNISVVQYDAEKGLPFPDTSFEAVLVDAPCSGTGTIRHNPELRYSLAPDDLVVLPAKQLCILRNASKLVKPSGLLVYSTCSLELEENEKVCEEFAAMQNSPRKVRPDVPGRFWTDGGYARTFPHRDKMDGFFIAAFESK